MDPIVVNGRLEEVVYRYGFPAYGYRLASGLYLEKRDGHLSTVSCTEWFLVDARTLKKLERVTVQSLAEAQAAAANAATSPRLEAKPRPLALELTLWAASFAAAVVFCVGIFTVIRIGLEEHTRPAPVPATRVAAIRRKLDAQRAPGETPDQVVARVIAALEDRIDREWSRCVAEHGDAACEQREAALLDGLDAAQRARHQDNELDAQLLRPAMDL